MAQRCILAVYLTLLVLATLALAEASAQEQPPVLTSAEVDRAISQLKNGRTRLHALEKLISFADCRLRKGSCVFCTGDAARDALMDRAADAVNASGDFKTVGLALNSKSLTLQYWALTVFPGESSVDSSQWLVHLPRIRELALTKDPNGGIRSRAYQCLRSFESQEEFLERCRETETCALNILEMLCYSDVHAYHGEMNRHLLRLLAHDDEDIRRGALTFITWDSRQVHLSDKVFIRVLELSRSKIPDERYFAVSALKVLREHDPPAIRQRMAELVPDPSQDVRGEIARVLCDQKERADVQMLLGRLLRDESAMVRYNTIWELGPGNYVKNLQVITAGADKRTAEMAANTLKRLKNGEKLNEQPKLIEEPE